MDIVARDKRSFRKISTLIQNVLEQCGWAILAHVPHGGAHTFLTRRKHGASLHEDDFLQIDVHRYLTVAAVPYVDLDDLIKRAVVVDGAPFLCRVDGATVSLLGYALMGIRAKARYELAFAEARSLNSESVANLLRRALGSQAEAFLARESRVARFGGKRC